MEWWNEIQAWFTSAAGSKIFLDAILPFVAIVLAGIIGASIGRSSATRVVEHHDRELTSAAVLALIAVGRKAAIWSSLGGDEKQHVDSIVTEADIRVRLLPTNGANLAADWAAHELGSMKKTSASFSFQAEQSFIDYRDRLLSWSAKPRRARKLFASDLEQWRYDDDSQAAVVAQQQQWATEHVEPTPTSSVPVVSAPVVPAPVVPVTPTPTAAPTVPAAAAPAPVMPAPVSARSTSSDPAPATASVPVTPGLATAAPPTAPPMDAPAPVGVAAVAAQQEDFDGDD